MIQSASKTSPIFLLGNARSGTSLLSRMLNSHPRICVPYEAHIYNVFWDYRDRYEPLSDPDRRRMLIKDVLSMRVCRDWAQPPQVDDVMDRIKRHNFHGIFEAIMDAWARIQNKPRWGEKTPHNGPYWRAINEGFPNAKFIHLVRDGRDCALSIINARFGPKLVYPAAIRWMRYLEVMNEMRQSLPADRVYELRYEDLLADSEKELRALCEYLGEEYAPSMLEYHAHKDNYMTDHRNRANLKKPVLTNNTQKWRKKMSEADQQRFEAVAREQLERYNYPTLYPDAQVSQWQHIKYTYLLHPPLRATAMLKNTKGWGDGLVRMRVKTRLILTPHHEPEPAEQPF